MVQLPDELVERADRRAALDGVSRSQVIRDALLAHLAPDEQGIARAYAEGYERQPYGGEDAWGDIAAFHDALARERTARVRSQKGRRR